MVSLCTYAVGIARRLHAATCLKEDRDNLRVAEDTCGKGVRKGVCNVSFNRTHTPWRLQFKVGREPHMCSAINCDSAHQGGFASACLLVRWRFDISASEDSEARRKDACQEVRTSLEVWPHGLGRARVVVLHLIGGMSYRDRLSTAPTASAYEAKCFTDETGRSAVLA